MSGPKRAEQGQMTEQVARNARPTTPRPSRSDGCRSGTSWRRSAAAGPDDDRPTQVRPRHVPVPLRRPAHGPRRGVRARRRRRALLGAARLRRHAPDRLGLLRPAGGERRDQARRGPARRGPTRTSSSRRRRCAATRCSFDWDRVLHTCDPEYYRWNQWLFLRLLREGPGLPQGRAGQLVPEGPDGAGQRAGRRRARASAAAPPVTKKKLTQWYFKITEYADRLLDDMAQLEGSWPDRVLTMQRNWIGRSTGADVQFDDRGPRRAGHGLHDAARHPVRRDVLRRRRRLRPGRRAGAPATPAERGRSTRTSSRSGRPTEIERLSHRAAEDRRLPAAARGQPGQRRADAGLRRRLRAGRLRHTARSWPCPRTTSATWTSPGRSACRCGSSSTPGDAPTRAETWQSATAGDGVLVNSRPARRAAQGRGDRARSPRTWRPTAWARAAVNYRLRDWLISRQRYWGTPIPIVHCPACGEVAGARTTSCRSSCRRARAWT